MALIYYLMRMFIARHSAVRNVRSYSNSQICKLIIVPATWNTNGHKTYFVSGLSHIICFFFSSDLSFSTQAQLWSYFLLILYQKRVLDSYCWLLITYRWAGFMAKHGLLLNSTAVDTQDGVFHYEKGWLFCILFLMFILAIGHITDTV